jgi:excisionase family DNA binding protein
MHQGDERVSGSGSPTKLPVDVAPPTKLLDRADDRLAYRIDDFCRAIGLGRTKVYAMIADGTLRTVVIGGRRLVPREAAEALLKQGAASVETSKAAKAAARVSGRDLRIDLLGGEINSEVIKFNLQSQYIARRFSIPLIRASLIAEYAFQTGRRT